MPEAKRRAAAIAVCSTMAGSFRRFIDLPEEADKIFDPVLGVETARIRQQPHLGPADPFFLVADRRPRLSERGAVSSETEHGQICGPESFHLFDEPPAALDQLFFGKLIGAGGRPRAKRGDSVAKF